jgi:hypothetical protein
MIRRRLSLIRPVHLLAFAALLLAVGGTAYAGAKIGSKDVRNESLKGVDIKNASLGGNELARGAVGARELDDDADESIGVTVLQTAGGEIDTLNEDGVTDVSQQGAGNYEVTIADGYVGCNYGFTLLGDAAGTAPVALAATEAEGQQVTFTLSDGTGTPTDIKDVTGLFGFSIVGICPD